MDIFIVSRTVINQSGHEVIGVFTSEVNASIYLRKYYLSKESTNILLESGCVLVDIPDTKRCEWLYSCAVFPLIDDILIDSLIP